MHVSTQCSRLNVRIESVRFGRGTLSKATVLSLILTISASRSSRYTAYCVLRGTWVTCPHGFSARACACYASCHDRGLPRVPAGFQPQPLRRYSNYRSGSSVWKHCHVLSCRDRTKGSCQGSASHARFVLSAAATVHLPIRPSGQRMFALVLGRD
jgi:hypothetical protein